VDRFASAVTTILANGGPAALYRGGLYRAAIAGLGIMVSNPISLPFLASLAVAASDGNAVPWPQVAMFAGAYAGIGALIYGGYALGATRLAQAGQALRWRIAMRGLAGAAIAAAGLFCLVRAVGV
jgi:threonine/homoserine/homoserine lactone efflux protein